MPSASLTRDFVAVARQRLAVARLAGDPAALAARAGLVPDPWQQRVLQSPAQTLLLCCARQVGKSTIVAMSIVAELLQAARTVVIVTPSERQSKELYRKVLAFWRALGRPVPHVSVQRTALELVNGSRLLALPGKADTIVGISAVNLLVADEAARVPDDVYNAVSPMLAASNGRLVALSSAKAKLGWWYGLWTLPAADDPDIERVTVLATECPRLSPAFLARERRRLGERIFNREYMCVFTDDESLAFRSEDIAAAQVDLETWDWALAVGARA